MRPIPLITASFVVAASWAACAGAFAQEVVARETPYQTRQLGAGYQPMLGVVLAPGRERESVSYSIFHALQGMQFSIVTPPIKTDVDLLFNQRWETDIVELSDADLASYNAQVAPNLALSKDRIYGLKHAGEFALKDQKIRYSVQSYLYARGAQSRFAPFNNQYSGVYFGERLVKAIEGRLVSDSEPK